MVREVSLLASARSDVTWRQAEVLAFQNRPRSRSSSLNSSVWWAPPSSMCTVPTVSSERAKNAMLRKRNPRYFESERASRVMSSAWVTPLPGRFARAWASRTSPRIAWWSA